MSLRHTAVLALVGWYLMMPQPGAPGKPPDFGAPLSQWNQVGGFDTAGACDKERDSRFNLAMKGLDEVKREIEAVPGPRNQPLSKTAPKVFEDDVEVSTFALQIQASRCIASDDPRLKGN